MVCSGSNHDVFLDRHINSENWKRDLHNSPAYLQYAYIQCRPKGDMGTSWATLDEGKVPKWVTLSRSTMMRSPWRFRNNGARECEGFGRLSSEVITAHTQPAIFNNTTCVGLSSFS
jgi:hypothetical protein